MGSKTKFSLSIIESLKFKDEELYRFEGKILTDILRLSRRGAEVDYIYIRTWKEFKSALRRFQKSRNRYLHISCHGNKAEIGLTLDTIPFTELGDDLAPCMEGKRLFLSACEVVDQSLANVVMTQTGCRSIIGPKRDILFGDAALMWATFYHLMFRDPENSAMKGGKIRWALRRIHHTFGEEFEYFTRDDNTAGYKNVDVQVR